MESLLAGDCLLFFCAFWDILKKKAEKKNAMKRFLSLVMICLLCLGLVGCGSKKDDGANTTSQGNTSSLSEGASSAISSAESRFDMDDKSETTASSSSETGSSASSSQTAQ